MHKIDTNTATANGEFTDGDSSAALEATDLNAAWFNTVQRELCNLVEGTGINLDAVKDNQVFDAVKKLGFRSYYASTGVVNIGANSGNTIIFCDVKDLIINGSIETTCSLWVVPLWGAGLGSEDRIKVTYRGSNQYIQKNCIFVALISEGLIEDIPYIGYSVPVSSGTRFNINSATVANLTATDGTVTNLNASNFMLGVYNVNDANRTTWDDSVNWTVGQMRALYYKGDSDYLSGLKYYYSETESQVFALNKGRTKIFVCIGKATIDGTEKALLVTSVIGTY